MNEPKVQTDADLPPAAESAKPGADPSPGMPHGIPEQLAGDDPAAKPTSDRQATETAPLKQGMRE